MDNSPDASDRTRTWAPPPAVVGGGWAVTALLAGLACWFAVSGDRGGLLLFGLGALVLLGVALHGSLIRPRLAADPDGLRIRSLAGTARLGWPQTEISLRDTRRLGRQVTTLEFDTGDELHVLGRLELGADPVDVHAVLLALRGPGVQPK